MNAEQEVLVRVLEAMNREREDYSLVEGMSELVDINGADLDELLQSGCLEKHTVCRRSYYSITQTGRQYLEQSVKNGEGIGDLGEKTPHKVGVELLRRWLDERSDIDGVGIYHAVDDHVFDVVGVSDGSLAYVGEVETPSNNTCAVVNDYEKLAEQDATAIWVVQNRTHAVDDILPALHEEGKLPEVPSGRSKNSMSALRDQIEEYDLPGMGTIWSYTELREAISI